jgi:MFS family permease
MPEHQPRAAAGTGQGLVLVVIAFLPILAIVSLAPSVPKIMAHFAYLPGAATLVPLMVTAPGLMIALLSPVAGVVTDRFGRRTPLLAATFFYGIFGISPYFLDSLGPIFATRFAVGICESVILTVSNTLIADYFALNSRRRWLTVQAVAGPILATATIMGSSVLTGYRWNGGFLIYGVALLIFVAAWVFVFEPEVQPAAPADRAALAGVFPWGMVGRYSAVTLLSSILYYVFIVNGGTALTAVGVDSPERLGVLISIASIGVPVGALLFGWLAKRWSSGALIATFLACLGAGLFAIGLARNPQTLVAVAMVQQVGAGMAVPALIFWVSQLLPAEFRGRGMGFWACAFFLGQFVSPAIVGLIRSRTGGILPAFSIMGGIALLAALVTLLLTRRAARAVATSSSG